MNAFFKALMYLLAYGGALAGLCGIGALVYLLLRRKPAADAPGIFTAPRGSCPRCGSIYVTSRYSGGISCRQCDECSYIFNTRP